MKRTALRRLLSALMAAVLALSLLPASALAYEPPDDPDMKETIINANENKNIL